LLTSGNESVRKGLMSTGPRKGTRFVPKYVSGAAHAVGATFYLVGADCDRRPVTASFELPSSKLPKDRFDNAQGIIQRVGARGIYAARALLRRNDTESKYEIGTFTMESATERNLDSVIDDIAVLTAAIDNSAESLPLYLAPDHGYGGF